THTHTETHTHTHTHAHTHRHTATHTHRHTDTQTHTQTDRHTQTDTHTDTQTHTHTDTQTHRHTDTHTIEPSDLGQKRWHKKASPPHPLTSPLGSLCHFFSLLRQGGRMSGAFSAQCQSEAPKTNHPGSSHVQLVPGLAGLACPDLGKLLRPISVRPVWAQKGGKQAGMVANVSPSTSCTHTPPPAL